MTVFCRPANIYKRIIAVAIDHLIITVIISGVYTNVFQGSLENVSIDTRQYLIYSGITIGYFFILEWFFNKTIGKKIMRLKVIRTTGQSQDIISAFIRNFLRPIDFIGFYLLGLIVITYTDLNQRIGDMAAGTYVIEE